MSSTACTRCACCSNSSTRNTSSGMKSTGTSIIDVSAMPVRRGLPAPPVLPPPGNPPPVGKVAFANSFWMSLVWLNILFFNPSTTPSSLFELSLNPFVNAAPSLTPASVTLGTSPVNAPAKFAAACLKFNCEALNNPLAICAIGFTRSLRIS